VINYYFIKYRLYRPRNICRVIPRHRWIYCVQ